MSRAEPMLPFERGLRYGDPDVWTGRQTRRYWHKKRHLTGMLGRKGRPTPRQRTPRRDG